MTRTIGIAALAIGALVAVAPVRAVPPAVTRAGG